MSKVEAKNDGLCLRDTIRTEDFILLLVYSLIAKRVDDDLVVTLIFPIKTYGEVEPRLDDWQRHVKYIAQNLSSNIRRWRHDMNDFSIPSPIIHRLVEFNNRSYPVRYTNKNNSQADLFRFTQCLYVFIQELIEVFVGFDIGTINYPNDLKLINTQPHAIFNINSNSIENLYSDTMKKIKNFGCAKEQSFALKVIFHPVVSSILQVYDLVGASHSGLDYFGEEVGEEVLEGFIFEWKNSNKRKFSEDNFTKNLRTTIKRLHQKAKPGIDKFKLIYGEDIDALKIFLRIDKTCNINDIKSSITRPSDVIYNLLLIDHLKCNP